MLKILWFLIKLGLIVALAIWVAEHPGSVEIQWLDYTVTFHVGVFLVGLLLLIFLTVFLYSFTKAVIGLPSSYKRYREIRDKDKGYRALTLGLSAVAAGDAKIASYQAHRAAKLIAEQGGLPLLLQAQAARLEGNEEEAQQKFLKLLDDKDASFLGIRGLLQASMEDGNYREALNLAQKALKSHPKQPWILQTVYDLQIKLRLWDDAQKTLYRIEKAGAFDADKALNDRLAIWMAQAERDLEDGDDANGLKMLHKILKAKSDFVPATSLLARYYYKSKQNVKAVKIIEKAWKIQPHAEYVKIWHLLIPQKSKDDPLARMRWYERLVAINENSADGQMAVGVVALEEGLWGEARSHFKKAEDIKPNAALYRHRAMLEGKASGNKEAETEWLERAAQASPQEVWVCRETGRIYEHWHALAEPHGSFNTIEWGLPFGAFHGAAALMHRSAVSEQNVSTFLDGPVRLVGK